MFILLIVSQFLFAAPIKSDSAKMIKDVRQILVSQSDLTTFKELGPEGYRQLVILANSAQESMDVRWNAMMAMARVGGELSRPELEKNMSHSLWFVRSAALNALSLIDKDHGLARAQQLLKNDPALLVRASALQVLAQQKDKDHSFLWTELYNPLNFDNGQSLPLRRSIIKVLSQSPKKNEMPKYIALIRDKDSVVRESAIRALEAFSRKKSPVTPIQDSVVSYWQNWYDKANF